jgi:cephalosporin hydroxylase
VTSRSFRNPIPGPLLDDIQLGTLRYVYRGLPMLKDPFDLAIYLRLIGELGPGTIVEIGSKAGGSALWFADMATAHGLDTRVVSVDLVRPALTDPRIRFLEGDARALGTTLTHELLDALPRPFLITEDSAHDLATTLATLRFFDAHLVVGDRIVVEDGIVSQLSGAAYLAYEDGPNRAVSQFLGETGDRYAVDDASCDMFGPNVTWNPNGYLKRVA